MTRLLSVIIVGLILATELRAQQPSPNMELALSGTLGSVKEKTESNGQSHEGDANTYAVAMFRPGFILGGGFSFEPEFQISAFKGEPPSFFLSANLGLTVSNGVGPFILGGYGVGNSIPLAGFMGGRMSDKLDVKLLNLGAGWKIPVGSNAALRIEFRHQQYTYEMTYPSYFGPSTATKYTFSMNNVLLGFSVLIFPREL